MTLPGTEILTFLNFKSSLRLETIQYVLCFKRIENISKMLRNILFNNFNCCSLQLPKVDHRLNMIVLCVGMP